MTNINFINHIIKPRKNVVRKIRVLGRQSSHISNILILTFMFFMSKKNYFVLCTFFSLENEFCSWVYFISKNSKYCPFYFRNNNIYLLYR